VTTYLLEIARILGNPNEYEKDMTGRSRLEARRLRRRYDDTAASRQGVPSGEAGDGESLLDGCRHHRRPRGLGFFHFL
jgi:hypothetical protein